MHNVHILIVLIPLSESIGSDDGSELICSHSLSLICRDAFSNEVIAVNGDDEFTSKKIDRNLLVVGMNTLGKLVNEKAQRTGGIGGKWFVMNVILNIV